MKNLLVVVDMLCGFLVEGNLADPRINRIVPSVVNLVKNAIKENDKIVAFKDSHKVDDIEFKTYPPHCIKGTKECDLIPQLKKYEDDMLIIEKSTTNGFNTLKFDALIKNHSFEKVVVCGCCTDICVFNFVDSLNSYFKKHNIKTTIEVVKDAVDTFNLKDHFADEVNRKYLKILENKGINITQTNLEMLEKI
jgi:nicotinamidase-related amidase